MSEIKPSNESQPAEEEQGREVFDEALFKNVLDAIIDLDSYEYIPTKSAVAETLHFLRQNEYLFALALMRESVAFSAACGLQKLAEHSEYNDGKENRQDNDVVKFALDAICRLQPVIEKSTQTRFCLRPRDALSLYGELVDKGVDFQKGLGACYLSQHLPVIKEGLADPKTSLTYKEYVEGIMKFGGQRDRERTSEMVMGLADECKGKEQFVLLVAFMKDSSDAAMILRAEELIEDALMPAGLPTQELLSDWRRSTKPERESHVRYANFKAIIDIERKKKGACEFLHKEFGISDFGRYPTKLLLKQVEEFESRKNPYGVIIFPRDDWNGAFYGDVYALKELYEQLGGEFSLRVFECETKTDIARVLIKSDRRYNPKDGSGHKISLLVLGGHGTERNINFGGYGEKLKANRSLSADDLMGGGVRRAGQFFEENPTIILSSCSTGAEGGIGQELSERFGAKVIAPKEPTSMEAIYASRRRGQTKFRFNAKYVAAGSKKLYKSGKLEQ